MGGRDFVAELIAAMPDEAARRAMDRALEPWRGSTIYLAKKPSRKVEAAHLLLRSGVRRADGIGILVTRFSISESQARKIWNVAQNSKKSACFAG